MRLGYILYSTLKSSKEINESDDIFSAQWTDLLWIKEEKGKKKKKKKSSYVFFITKYPITW